jgi:arylsulfatase A-like enzyme
MRYNIKYLFVIVLLLGFSSAFAASPNIVVIISDDHGWMDYGFMGHPHIKTPQLDQLAAHSLVFPRGYVPNALCSPSLASIITGRYPHEHLITYNDPPAPPGGKVGQWRDHPHYLAAWDEMRSFITKVPTLPRLLQQKGYVSLQTGKWWLGTPANGGFTAGMSHGEKTRGGRHGDEGLDVGRKTMQRAEPKQTVFCVVCTDASPQPAHRAASLD